MVPLPTAKAKAFQLGSMLRLWKAGAMRQRPSTLCAALVVVVLAMVTVCGLLLYDPTQRSVFFMRPLFASSSSSSASSIHQHTVRREDGGGAGLPTSLAYLTSACTADEVVQVMAIHHSLSAVQARYTLHVLLAATIPAHATAALKQLASLSVPSSSSTQSALFASSRAASVAPQLYLSLVAASSCQSAVDPFHHSTLLAEYDRVLYVHPASLFVRNVDAVFDLSRVLPAGSVSADGQLDGNVVLFEPRESSANSADQPHSILPTAYWTSVNIDTASTVSKGGSSSTAIARFDGPDTPWNWYMLLAHPSLVVSPPTLYWLWMHHARTAYNATGSAAPFDALPLPSLLASEELAAAGTEYRIYIPPAHTVCEYHPPQQQQSMDKFSVLVGHFYTGNPYRLQLMSQLVSHYRDMPSLHTIFVTWHNPNSTVPSVLLDAIQHDRQTRQSNDSAAYVAPVVFLPMRTDSLNNRFLPVPASVTRALFVTDEDVRVPAAEMELGFSVWRTSPQQLVGYFPRSHGVNPPPKPRKGVQVVEEGTRPQWEYIWKTAVVTAEYSIVLTKGMFVDAVYNYMYTCTLPRRFHQYVDLFTNGEDILFQMLATGLTGLPPIAVDSHPDEFGVPVANGSALAGGISSGAGHYELRSVLTTDLVTLFGTMPLRYNKHMAAGYRRPLAVKKQLDELVNVSSLSLSLPT